MEDKLQSADAYPHNGNMLRTYFKAHSVNRAELARRMSVAGSTVMQYFDSQSLQLGILWKISLALKHNFVAELGEKLPVDYTTQRETELKQQIEDLQGELEKTKFELSIYKNIVGK
jgi:transcriptional regulator with XRE-family HTH domain